MSQNSCSFIFVITNVKILTKCANHISSYEILFKFIIYLMYKIFKER